MHGKSNNGYRHEDSGSLQPEQGAGTSDQGDDESLEGWLRGAGRIAEGRRGCRRADVLAQVRRGLGFVGDDSNDEGESQVAGEGDEPSVSDESGNDLDDGAPSALGGSGQPSDDDHLDLPEMTIEQRLTLAEVQAKLGFPTVAVMIGRYQILRRIDSGGMGVVYQAWDEKAGRNVALKRLHTFGSEHDAALAASARQEVKAMAALRHDNVVVVHDLYEEGPLRVIVMEFAPGQTLREWLDVAVYGLDELIKIFLAIAVGLEAIHKARFFHGDLKLDNVIIDAEGKPRIIDFGMAAQVGQDPIGGTPEYMASELLGSNDEDVAVARETLRMDLADQYSFCVMLFLALAERHPYLGEAEFKETLRRSGEATPPAEVRRQYRTYLSESQRRRSIRWPDPSIRRMPTWLRTLLHRGLAADAGDRYTSMAAVIHALQYPTRRSQWRRRGALAAGAVVLGAALTGGYVQATARKPCQDVSAALAGVWDAATRGAIEARDPEAAKLLGAYADRWLSVSKETCEATFIKEEAPSAVLSARRACLDRRRDELAMLVDAAKQGAVTAFQASSQLRDPEPCAVVDAAPDRWAAAQEDAFNQLRHDLRGAEIEGDFQKGRTIADAAIADARATHFFPLLAEAHYERGRLGLLEVTLVHDDENLRAEASRDVASAIAIAGDLGDQALLLEARIFNGRIAAARGDGIDALASIVSRAERLGPGLQRQLNDLRGMAAYREALASDGQARIGLLHRARDLFTEAIDGHRASGDGYAEAKAQENLGDVFKELDAAGSSAAQADAAAAYARASELWQGGRGDKVPALGTLLARRIDLVPEAEAEGLCGEADRWLAGASLAAASRRRVDAELALACSRLDWKADPPRAQGYARRARAGDLPAEEHLAALLTSAMITADDPTASRADVAEAVTWLDEADGLLANLPERQRQAQSENTVQVRETRRTLKERTDQR